MGMTYRRLGKAGLKVSAVALGTWFTYGEGQVDADEARRILETAYDLGVNYIDLADEYGLGEAERQVGAILKPLPRHTLVLASKVFFPMSKDVNDRGLSRKHIMESIDHSLRRLGTDYLDIYFCHRFDRDTPLEETARAMHDLVQQGKVLYWGTSEWSTMHIREAHRVCEHYGLHKPQVEQSQYSMVVRQRVEGALLPVVRRYGIGLVVVSPLAHGLLTGKYDDGIPGDSRLGRRAASRARYLHQEALEKVRQLKPLADRLGLSRAQLALAWLLRHEAVSSVITGVTSVAQVRSNVGAAAVALSEAVIEEIARVLGRVEIPDAVIDASV